MSQFIQNLGLTTINNVKGLGLSLIFLLQSILVMPRIHKSFSHLVKQIYVLGVLSLPIIIVSGLFIGLVLALQGYTILVKFASEQSVGVLVTLALLRELGPVVTALLFAGRAGSAITAEIGLMQATEQIASLDMMGVNPKYRIVAPRFWGGLISMPILALIFNVVGIWGGSVISAWLGIDEGSFWGNIKANVNWHDDIINGIIKSLVFGIIVNWIAIYQGFFLKPTAEGISYATTKTVVYSSLSILGFDFILTALMFSSI